MTGLRAANAEAVSPPATENARGKLLAPKTATGPRGCSMRRMSGLGMGLRSGFGVSIRASTQEPSRTALPNSLSWLTVRSRSPRQSIYSQSCLFICSLEQNVSPSATISSPTASRNRAVCDAVDLLPDRSGFFREFGCPGDFFRARLVKCWLDNRGLTGIIPAEGRLPGRREIRADDIFSVNTKGRHSYSLTVRIL